MKEIKRKCPMCGNYVSIEEWPTYNGRYYAYCRDCKRFTQRIWVRQKREAAKSEPKCGGNQYTAADEAEECIYCGHHELEKMDTLEPEDGEEKCLVNLSLKKVE